MFFQQLHPLSELAARHDLTVLGSAPRDPPYDHRPVKDGQTLEFGDVAVTVPHTPGHTLEHISLLVHDRSVSDERALLLSGGAPLVGDVACSGLLGDDDAATPSSGDVLPHHRPTCPVCRASTEWPGAGST